MLRPATPLSILLFAAFGLLLISVLSTPIIKAIPLGTFQGVNFGVFGYCNGDTCSAIEIGYDTSKVFTTNNASDFDLPSSTRTTLSAILIVHPVAALITLIMLILAIVSHLHSPSHSSRYLLLVFILSIVDLLVCLLAFLIDVLLFVPHMAFGSYLVLAATILVALSGLVSCAMRRTLVNRKARKKRIAENAEMSGENYYNRVGQTTTTPAAPTMPSISGANGDGDSKLPTFATYEKPEDRSSDERIPLTARSPTDRSPNNMPTDMSTAETMYSGPAGPRRAPSIPRDQFGNPMNPPPDAYGMRRPSGESQRPRGRGGMPPGGYRGRGGYGGRGGGYVPYGPPPGGRGGYGPPGRGGGYGPAQGRGGGYGPPPRSFTGGSTRGGRPPPPGYNNGPGPIDQRGPPADAYGYGARGPSPGPPSAPGYNNVNQSMPSVSTGSYDAYNPDRADRESILPRAESPPPLPGADENMPGQAVAMGHVHASPANASQNYGQFRDSDADIMGMVGLQQGLPQRSNTNQKHDTYTSDASKYSQPDEYVPPRAAWNQSPGGRNSPGASAPQQPGSRPGTASPAPPPVTAGDNYYEDVDPRFASPAAPPARLSPGVRGTPPPQPGQLAMHTEHSYDDLTIPEGARSPAESERSNFTSISQRGINPRWAPPPGQQYAGMQGMPPRRPVGQQRKDILLDSNPDFQLPGARGGGAARGGAAGGYPGGL